MTLHDPLPEIERLHERFRGGWMLDSRDLTIRRADKSLVLTAASIDVAYSLIGVPSVLQSAAVEIRRLRELEFAVDDVIRGWHR